MKPTLVINPADDGAFAAAARRHVEDGASCTRELERRLRLVYPKAVVHARELAAEGMLIWYVYRDGRWVKSGPRASEPGGSAHDG